MRLALVYLAMVLCFLSTNYAYGDDFCFRYFSLAPTRLSELSEQKEELIQRALQSPIEELTLPYAMTPRIQIQKTDLRIILNLNSMARVSLVVFQKEADVIPTRGWVESWHNLMKRFKGTYFLIRFESIEERAQFLKSIHYRADLHEGVLSEKPILLLNSEQFYSLEFTQRSRSSKDAQVPSTRMELLRISDRQVETKSTVYYFSAGRPVGFERGREAFRILSGPVENYASHEAILKRQTGNSGVEDPLVLLQKSREMIQDRHSKMFSDSALTEALQAAVSQGYSKRKVTLEALQALVKNQIEKIEAQAPKLDLSCGLEKSDLARSSEEKQSRVLFLRFVWFRELAIEDGLIYSKENLLHGQMLDLALTPQIVNPYFSNAAPGSNMILSQTRGGVLRLEFSADQKLLDVTLADTSMSIVGHNPKQNQPIQMSEKEKAEFAGLVRSRLFH